SNSICRALAGATIPNFWAWTRSIRFVIRFSTAYDTDNYNAQVSNA
ncbi:MAG: hypothetical protein RLZ39_527, partial [Bacteroidota bacterium]